MFWQTSLLNIEQLLAKVFKHSLISVTKGYDFNFVLTFNYFTITEVFIGNVSFNAAALVGSCPICYITTTEL